jgi:PKD repeat protein
MSIGCTMKKQEAPALSGPSEFSTSIAIAVSPDILRQDGVSQSVITVTARGPNGAPVGNLPLRAEIRVAGTLTNFGALSTRAPVTAGDGRAMLVYTAPPSPPVSSSDGTLVDIVITPVGTDFSSAASRSASLRLVPQGVVLPPESLRADFDVEPASPKVNQTVVFNGSKSSAPASSPIVSYHWDYGDGRTGSGRMPSYQYRTVGTYAVRLTVTDTLGRSAQHSKTIVVMPDVEPTAAFTYSPTPVRINREVFFNAAQSAAAPGRRITQYAWDFGDGTPGAAGLQVVKIFQTAGTYTVTLTVTDDANRSKSVAQLVQVAP